VHDVPRNLLHWHPWCTGVVVCVTLLQPPQLPQALTAGAASIVLSSCSAACTSAGTRIRISRAAFAANDVVCAMRCGPWWALHITLGGYVAAF
jgi:hypothetical protein